MTQDDESTKRITEFDKKSDIWLYKMHIIREENIGTKDGKSPWS